MSKLQALPVVNDRAIVDVINKKRLIDWVKFDLVLEHEQYSSHCNFWSFIMLYWLNRLEVEKHIAESLVAPSTRGDLADSARTTSVKNTSSSAKKLKHA